MLLNRKKYFKLTTNRNTWENTVSERIPTVFDMCRHC